jgi:nitrate reductase gamma subunit
MAALIFTVLPYVCLAIFVVGHVARYRHDKLGWSTRTSEVFEKRWLMWGSPMFHFGALFVIAGHAGGLLIPEGLTRALGISDHAYHLVAVWAGAVAGTVMCVGLALLIARRFVLSERLRIVTTPMDRVLYALLVAETVVGMWQTVAINIFGSGYEYRGTVSVWFRQVFTLSTDPALLMSAPMVYRLHVVLACLIIAVWPFTRLVHVWSVPIAYLARPFVVYRRRPGRPVRAGSRMARNARRGW